MSDDGAVKSAWAEVGEVFKDIGRRFRDSYREVSDKAGDQTEQAGESVERSLETVKAALKDTVAAIDQAAKDANTKEEAKEAGSALLRALGTTLSEVGDSLQRTADKDDGRPSS